MARPTTWRRGFNVGSFFDPEGSIDLVTLQPGETLGGTWFSYNLRSIGNVTVNTNPPLSNSVTVAALIVSADGSPPVLPLNSPFVDWVWWEQVGFNHEIVNTIDFAYMNSSWTGGQERKAQGQRKNEGIDNQVLRFAWQTFQGSATAAEVAFDVTASVSALIILPA